MVSVVIYTLTSYTSVNFLIKNSLKSKENSKKNKRLYLFFWFLRLSLLTIFFALIFIFIDHVSSEGLILGVTFSLFINFFIIFIKIKYSNWS